MPAHPRVGTAGAPRTRRRSPSSTTGWSTAASARVHGKRYRHVISVREYALPDDEIEHKLYARGVGVIDELPPEGAVGLVGCERA